MYRAAAFSDNTKKAYSTHLSTYLRYCDQMNCTPVPAPQDQICLYAAYLARSLKSNSVRQYLNIVLLLHLENGFENPCKDSWQLMSVLKGMDRLLGTPVARKTPVDPVLLLQMRRHLDPESLFDCKF